jgi:tripartite-type tricarboxylate transporter receptor subunit TctC
MYCCCPFAIRCLAVVLLFFAGAAAAEEYPSRPITLIVPVAAGGPTDVAARILGSIAEKELKQPIVVVNRGGAGSQVGTTEFARAKPDGYTLGFLLPPTTNAIILNPARQAIFDEKSFAPIINHVIDAGVIWVSAESPIKSFQDLIDAAKKAPGTVRASTTGLLSDDHLYILMTEEATGAKFRIVHLEGAAGQYKETLGGNVDVSFDNVGNVTKPLKAGLIRVLAVADPERSPFLPDVPTMKELGYPTVVSASTRGLAAPKGTPKPIIDKLAEVFKRAMDDPDHAKRMAEQGLAVRPMLPEEFTAYWLNAHEQTRKLVEWANKRPQ